MATDVVAIATRLVEHLEVLWDHHAGDSEELATSIDFVKDDAEKLLQLLTRAVPS